MFPELRLIQLLILHYHHSTCCSLPGTASFTFPVNVSIIVKLMQVSPVCTQCVKVRTIKIFFKQEANGTHCLSEKPVKINKLI